MATRFVPALLLSLAICLPTTAYPKGRHGGSSPMRVVLAAVVVLVFSSALDQNCRRIGNQTFCDNGVSSEPDRQQHLRQLPGRAPG